MINRLKEIICHFVVLSIWVGIIILVEETRKNNIFSIDSIITIVTLTSLALQNLKIDEIRKLQEKVALKFSLYEFFRRSYHSFLGLTIFVIPLVSYELKNYFINDGVDLNEYLKLTNGYIILGFIYFFLNLFLSFLGYKFDTLSKNNIQKKYGMFYGILLFLYITIKLSAIK